MNCPMCREHPALLEREAKLDQCGETYLPAIERFCIVCEYSETVPTSKQWKSRTLSPHKPVTV